jgi:hypothetical protein
MTSLRQSSNLLTRVAILIYISRKGCEPLVMPRGDESFALLCHLTFPLSQSAPINIYFRLLSVISSC